ncbi:hemerythrin domain-containing protein [Rodentibacter genomosp. 2]|uniref:Hemerythrin-like domain-containing protein n=1 Tax=Rodentibacter genomosp. 2 TaxID=1908266 RepID=A0A1V3JPD3_9PAST|nr:hemerythrin domain-containing protein [Rodentibacter genomosp. 2]OOF58074.1 hypothetical protein BKK56_00050 [Rodentibacter genomosp. 2]OOF58498.1 hypothetical protein BKK55_02505 [Rodentibacter genomosp. 2]
MQILEPQQFASWNDPIEMLYTCHSKVKRFCHQLSILPGYLEKNGVNQAVLNDVKIILQYFNCAAPLHHDDEEKDFFPALMLKAPEIQSQVEELERQHIDLHENWRLLSEQLEDLIAQESISVDPALIQRFVLGYDKHILIEEPLFELGKQHLTETELKAIGQVMSNRRHP